jgi:hypothetical protein
MSGHGPQGQFETDNGGPQCAVAVRPARAMATGDGGGVIALCRCVG